MSLSFFIAVLLLSKKFHNLPGRNLLSFCISRLLLIRIYSHALATGGYINNEILAKLSLYFYLCSYTWNLIIAYDTWRTVRISSTQCLTVSGDRWRRFWVYSFFAWLSPLISLTPYVNSWVIMKNIRSYQIGKNEAVDLDYTAYLFLFANLGNIYFGNASLYYIWRNGNSIQRKQTPERNFIENFALPMRLLLFGGYFMLIGMLFWFLQWGEWAFYISVIVSYQGTLMTFLFTYRKNVFESIDVSRYNIKGCT